MARNSSGSRLRKRPRTSTSGPPGEAGPSVAPAPIQSPDDFRSRFHERLFHDDISTRSILPSKHVDFYSFETLGIRELVSRIGLGGFFSMRGPSVPRVVRVFYANLSFGGGSGICTSYIYGQEFSFTADDINRLIGWVAPEGEDVDVYYQESARCPFITDGWVEFRRLILEEVPDSVAFRKPTTRDLNVQARVLYNMLTHTLFQRGGHRDLVNFMDLYVLEKIYRGRWFNPGAIILSHMEEVLKVHTKHLPYRTLIYRLVEACCCPIPPSETRRIERRTDAFDDLHLRGMGIVQVDGAWYFRPGVAAAPRPRDDDSDDDGDTDPTPTTPTAPPPSPPPLPHEDFIHTATAAASPPPPPTTTPVGDIDIRRTLAEVQAHQRRLQAGQERMQVTLDQILDVLRRLTPQSLWAIDLSDFAPAAGGDPSDGRDHADTDMGAPAEEGVVPDGGVPDATPGIADLPATPAALPPSSDDVDGALAVTPGWATTPDASSTADAPTMPHAPSRSDPPTSPDASTSPDTSVL